MQHPHQRCNYSRMGRQSQVSAAEWQEGEMPLECPLKVLVHTSYPYFNLTLT